MATTAPIIIPVKTKGLSDLQKLEKRMEALERDATKLTRKLPQTSNAIKQTGRAAGTASGNIQRMGVAFRSTVAPLIAAVGAVTALSRSLSVLAERESDTLVLSRNLQNIGQGAEKLAELQAVADRLDLGTLFNSEDFNKGFALLTSFKNIGVDSYERVSKAAADLATITGTDLKSAQLQLAKALENPVEGMSALSRSGTTFTKTQKEFVKSLVESNQGLEAQAYILSIVEGQYNGAAKAAAGGYAGALDTLSKRWRDVNEQIGKVVQPAATFFLNTLSGYLLTVTEELVKTAKALAVLSRWAQQAAGFIKGLGEQFQIAAVKTYQFFERLSEVVGLQPQFAKFGSLVSENIDQITDAALRAIPIIGQYFSVLNALETLRGGVNKAGKIEGTDVDNNPMQGADLDMAGIREQQRWADLMKSFQITTPKTSGGRSAGSRGLSEAEKAQKLLERQTEAGDEIEKQLRRQIKLTQTKGEFDKKNLQIIYDYQDEIAQIIKTAAPLQQEGLFAQAAILRDEQHLDNMKAAITALAGGVTDDYVKALDESNKELTQNEELLKGAYEIVSNQLTSGIQGLIDGTKEWGDVLSDILGQLGSMFLQAGFNGLGKGLKIPGYADGGRPPTGEVSVIGERGPELFVPDQAGTVIPNDAFDAATAALSRSGGGGGGSTESNDAAFAAASTAVQEKMSIMRQGQEQAINNPKPIDIRYQATVINNETYVTAQQFQAGMSKTANQARAQTLKDLRNKPAARSRAGVS